MDKNIKTYIKRMLGKNNIYYLKTVRQYAKYLIDRVVGNYGHIRCNSPYSVYGIPQKHVFFGYYDIQQLNAENDKLLVHILDKNASAGKTPVTIAYIDKKSGRFINISHSYAWSWQQGARLRWNSKNPSQIYFNNYDDKGYCCELWDIASKEKIKRFSKAFYDIAPNNKYGLSLNFTRLQRLRPGYGYSNEPDSTCDLQYPCDDGIVYVDLGNESEKLIVSLRELANKHGLSEKYNGYINHISISPDSKRFIFFFLWTEENYLPWDNCLYSYDVESDELKLVEQEIIVSHYCWISNSEVLITSISGDYYKYDLNTGERKKISTEYLKHDGHPCYINGERILTDTYPLEKDYQHVFMTDQYGQNYLEVLEQYSDPRLFEERRCDAHPRYSQSNNIVTVDSTYIRGERCVIEISL